MVWRVLVSCLVSVFCFHASAAESESFHIGGWSGGAYTSDRTGEFTHCAISAAYRSGISVVFVIDPKLQWSMGFVNKRWALGKGSTYDVSYQIDRGPIVNAKALAIGTDMVRIRLLDSSKLFEDFQKGYELAVMTQGQTFRFSLTDSSAALSRALSCAIRNAPGASASTTNPFAGRNANNDPFGRSATQTLSDPVTAPFHADAVAFAANLLSVAGVPGYRILSRDELSEGLQPYDAVWVAGDVAGTVKVVAAKDASTADEIATIVVALGSSRCKGKFASARLPSADGSGSVRIKSACQTAESTTQDENIIVARRGGGHYNLGIFSIGQEVIPELVSGTSGKLLDATLRLGKPQ